MDKYKLMRMAENLEEDAIKFDEVDELFPQEGESAEDFKRKYKEFYTDIKISIKEDWWAVLAHLIFLYIIVIFDKLWHINLLRVQGGSKWKIISISVF